MPTYQNIFLEIIKEKSLKLICLFSFSKDWYFFLLNFSLISQEVLCKISATVLFRKCLKLWIDSAFGGPRNATFNGWDENSPSLWRAANDDNVDCEPKHTLNMPYMYVEEE